MKISVVTPSYNQSAFIEEAVRSVKEQECPSREHIVIDGASTDGTVEMLRRFGSQPGFTHLRWTSEPDRGQSDALNKGFRMATGDIIGWLNSDDRYHPGCFSTVVRAFQKHPKADIIYGDYIYVDERGRPWQVRREIEFSLFVLRHHRVLYIPTTATFFRRRIFDEGNFVDAEVDYAMDYEFFLRLASRGYRFKHIPYLLADFRWHPRSKTGSAAGKQLAEHDRIAQMYSPLLRKLPDGAARRVLFRVLRLVAAAARYSEKALRGYYFQQFRPGTIESRGARPDPAAKTL